MEYKNILENYISTLREKTGYMVDSLKENIAKYTPSKKTVVALVMAGYLPFVAAGCAGVNKGIPMSQLKAYSEAEPTAVKKKMKKAERDDLVGLLGKIVGTSALLYGIGWASNKVSSSSSGGSCVSSTPSAGMGTTAHKIAGLLE